MARSTQPSPANQWPSYVPYPRPTTSQQAQADVNAIVRHEIGPPNWADNAAHTITHDAGAVVHGAASVGDFLGKLSDPHTWVRVGEVVVGIVFLVVGADHLFGTDMTGKAAKAAPYLLA